MSRGKEATSEQSSSVHKGAGYDEVYLSGRVPVKDVTWSIEKEQSTHSPTEKEEEGCKRMRKGRKRVTRRWWAKWTIMTLGPSSFL